MAGSRNFSIPAISRKDLMALTEEAAKVSGIPYVMDAYNKKPRRSSTANPGFASAVSKGSSPQRSPFLLAPWGAGPNSFDRAENLRK